MEKEICGCCGERIENQGIKENYEDNELEEELRYCESCIRSLAETGKIADLLDRIAETLGEERSEKFKNMDISLKSAFALKCIRSGAIQGGTMGHIETLRTITASGL